MSDAYFSGGAAESCATIEQNQELAAKCGPNCPIEAKSEIPAPPAPSLREKLKAIRDSDHPASPWARNVVQCLDELKLRPDDPDTLRQLGKNVALLDRGMTRAWVFTSHAAPLTDDDLAAIFGLGDPQ